MARQSSNLHVKDSFTCNMMKVAVYLFEFYGKRYEMPNKVNYSKELEKKIDEFQKEGRYPSLLLHACCAPCSSYCLEYLRQYFDITVFYYNPNIMNEPEYRKRVDEEKRLIAAYNKQVEEGNFEGMNSDQGARIINIIEGDYVVSDYLNAVWGLKAALKAETDALSVLNFVLKSLRESRRKKVLSFLQRLSRYLL